VSRAPASPLWRDDAKLRVGISSCLLGEEVRFDGGHKRDRFLTDQLGPFVEWVPVCPELELGMGVPREAVHLVREGEGIRMVGTQSGRDWTAAMEAFAARRVRALAKLELCGYVLKQDSPSCGMERVKVREKTGLARRDGRGLFASALREAEPALPVEEEGRLNDPVLRENWIERVFAYRRLRSLFAGRFSVVRLVAFHTAHKLQLLAHSPEAYRRLGRLVAGAKRMGPAELERRYALEYMAALAVHATPRRHVNVLEHCLGQFRDRLDAGARAALAQQIADYGAGLVPLVVPLTLIRHYVERLEIEYLAGQVYLEPHPKELMLRNHV
jgi:uncharacterized protein YbgA (DUF1722 family)/uncharacterized protein YbbK (DUF523 family)